jgi:hypothetical protein
MSVQNLPASVRRLAGAAALAASLAFPAPSAASEICGDVNDNGDVSTSDALLVLRASVGQSVALVCEAADITSYGNTTAFTESDTFGENFLLGHEIEIEEEATITHFGVIAKSSGQQVRFALYTSAAGEPQNLVIGSGAATLTGGLQEVAVPPKRIAAGTYWLMALYDVEATVGVDFTGDNAIRLRAMPFGDQMPEQFGAASGYTGDEFNYYVKVQL